MYNQLEHDCSVYFASIAEGGRRFAEAYLSQPRVLQYAAEVLTNYALHVFPAKGRQHMIGIKPATAMSSLSLFSERSLNDIGLETGTDKSSRAHDYLGYYENALRGLSRIDRILEIGVHEGASLRMWRDFLPRARIVGLDLLP